MDLYLVSITYLLLVVMDWEFRKNKPLFCNK
jgi:hypothetical protein